MFGVPVTYFYDFAGVPERLRPYIMADFFRAGAKHLVLTDELIRQIMINPGLADVLLKEMADNGLSFCDAHAPFNDNRNLTCPDPAKRGIMLARLEMVIDIATYMQAGTVTVHIGDNRNSAEKATEKHKMWIKDTIREILPLLEKRKIVMCLENIWHSPATPEFLNELMEEFPSPYLGICYDSGHANIMDKGREYATGAAYNSWLAIENCKQPPWDDRILEKLLPNIVNCHLHDNSRWHDSHLLLGEGNIDWKKTVGLLKKAPRLKVVQAEVIIPKEHSISDLVASFDRLMQM